MNEPTTLQEAIVFFDDADRALQYFVARRWANGVTCPTCGSQDVRFLANQRRWECKAKHAKKQFSAKVGTIFEDSAIALEKWLCAVWLVTNCKNGISSHEIARDLGITQKSAWHMLHRIRLGMQDTTTGGKLSGEVEVDETFIGGKARNMHADVKARKIQGRRGPEGKGHRCGGSRAWWQGSREGRRQAQEEGPASVGT
ncbi:MAG: IS1595 family transposase [Acidobacteriota bacterium]